MRTSITLLAAGVVFVLAVGSPGFAGRANAHYSPMKHVHKDHPKIRCVQNHHWLKNGVLMHTESCRRVRW
jgi:hypothetical protein